MVHGDQDVPVLAHTDQLRRREELERPNVVLKKNDELDKTAPVMVPFRRRERLNNGVPPNRFGFDSVREM